MWLCKVMLPVRLLTVSGSTIRVRAILFQGSVQQQISISFEDRDVGANPTPRTMTGVSLVDRTRSKKVDPD
jgi:hypothetical protein